MLSAQMIKILKLCNMYNVKISYNQILKICSVDEEVFERIIYYFSECDKEKRSFFLEVFLCKEFIEYYAYERILKLIAKVNSDYLEELISILSKEDITKMPKLMDYLNVYYAIANNKIYFLTQEKFNKILEIFPEAASDFTNDELMELLLERLELTYNYYVVNEDVLYLEDGGEDLLRTIDMHYKFRRKNKECNTDTLIRKLKRKEQLEAKGKIIEVDFTKEQK